MSGTPGCRNRLEEQVKNRSRQRNAGGGMEQSLEEGQRTGGPARSRSTKWRIVRNKIRHRSRNIRGRIKTRGLPEC